MMMKADRAALKRAARDKLRRAETRPWRVVLAYILLTTGVTTLVTAAIGNPLNAVLNAMTAAANAGYSSEEILTIVGSISQRQGAQSALTFFLNILLRLYTTVMAFGFMAYNLRRTRGEENGTRDLLCGFGMVGRVVVLSLAVFFFTLGWSLLVMFPIFMALTIGTTAALFVLTTEVGFWVIIGVVYLVCIVGAVLVYYLALRYSMASFLLLDHPEWGPMEAVRGSRGMLAGRLGELFRLELSFLGWGVLQIAIGVGIMYGGSSLMNLLGVPAAVSNWVGAALNILGVLPLGLWLMPYYQGTLSEYYCFLASHADPGPKLKVEPMDDYHGPVSF